MPITQRAIRRRLIAALLLPLIYGCSEQQPPCPTTQHTTTAPSAGCLVIKANKLLVIEDRRGRVSIPGGSVEAGESAACGAHRETWEETGLNVKPDRQLKVFENGFHLYRCQLIEPDQKIDPPMRFEVRRAFWLSSQEFDRHTWRFPNQTPLLANWIEETQPQRKTGLNGTESYPSPSP